MSEQSSGPGPNHPDRISGGHIDAYKMMDTMTDEDLVDAARSVVLSVTRRMPQSMPGSQVPREMTHAMDFLARTVIVKVRDMGQFGLRQQPDAVKRKLADATAYLSSVLGINDGSLGLNSVSQAEQDHKNFETFISDVDYAQGRLYSYDYPAGREIETQAMTGLCVNTLDFLGELSKGEHLGDYTRTKVLGAVNNLESLSRKY